MIKRDYNENERAWLWLSRVFGANVRAVDALLPKGASPAELRRDVLCGASLPTSPVVKEEKRALLKASADDASIDRYVDWLCGRGVYAVTRESSDYPKLLGEIYDPPTVLYVIGRLQSDLKLPIAVIGSRKSSDYGIRMAEFFGAELAKREGCVISGLAVGCDSAAASGALSVADSAYPTIAVLGSGVNVVYPQKNRRLYCEIAERGAVISELLPNQPPSKLSFPQRNRIISGMARGVLVVEAGEHSGTSITAEFALEHGRDVFAVPGRLTDPMSRGTNAMIKRGEAKAVFDIDDILCEYGLSSAEAATPVRSIDTAGMTREQAMLCELLIKGEKNVDELCMLTGLGVDQINIYLTELELSGIIKQLSHKVYSI